MEAPAPDPNPALAVYSSFLEYSSHKSDTDSFVDVGAELYDSLSVHSTSLGRSESGVSTSTAEDLQLRPEDIQVLNKLGEGYFGEVYSGLWLGQPIAVKILKTTATSAQEEFTREALVLSRLRHPNIIQLWGVCTRRDGKDMMVSELCDGSLHSLIHSKAPVALLLWLRVAYDICGGLTYLHSRRPPVVHRDLSSANVLLTAPLSQLMDHVTDLRWPVAKLSDFGLSRVMDWYMTQRTGNLFYMAVEVYQGEHYSEKADVYSFGITMCEMFSRQQPFGGLGPHKAAFQAASMGVRPAVPSMISPYTQALITQCWNADPLQRPASADMLTSLRQIMHEHTDGEAIVSSASENTASLSVTESSHSLEYPEFVSLDEQLCVCVREDDVDGVRRILSTSSDALDINKRFGLEDNKTCLHMARSAECVRVLCDYGADPYMLDNNLRTPLHDFYEQGMGCCIQTLLAYGCREDMVDKDGHIPAQCIKLDIALVRIIGERAVEDMKWLVQQPVITRNNTDTQMFKILLRKVASYKSWNCFAALLNAFEGTEICLAGMDLGREGFTAIASVLKTKKFSKIDLVGNKLVLKDKNILTPGIRKLLGVLCVCREQIVELDLRRNNIANESSHILVEPIIGCENLEILNGYTFKYNQSEAQSWNADRVLVVSTDNDEIHSKIETLEKRVKLIRDIPRSLPPDLFNEVQVKQGLINKLKREVGGLRFVQRDEIPLEQYEAAFIVRRAPLTLRYISFNGIQLTEGSVREICSLITSRKLSSLLLANTSINDAAVFHLGDALGSDDAQLTELMLDGNPAITMVGISYLFIKLQSNATLRKLHLGSTHFNCEIPEELQQVIASTLTENRCLSVISFDGNIYPKSLRGDGGTAYHQILGKDVKAMPTILQRMLQLNESRCHYGMHDLKFNGLETILRVLVAREALTTLDISGSMLQTDRFEELENVISTLPNLKHLDLSDLYSKDRGLPGFLRGGLTAKCVQRLCDCLLRSCIHIKHLALCNNPILDGRTCFPTMGNEVKVFDLKGAGEYDSGTLATVLTFNDESFVVRFENGTERDLKLPHYVENYRGDIIVKPPSVASLKVEEDLSGLLALRNFVATATTLRRLWVRRVVVDNIHDRDPHVSVDATVRLVLEDVITNCRLYTQAPGEVVHVTGPECDDVPDFSPGDCVSVEQADSEDLEHLHSHFVELDEVSYRKDWENVSKRNYRLTNVDRNCDGNLYLDGYCFDSQTINQNILNLTEYNGRRLPQRRFFRLDESWKEQLEAMTIPDTQQEVKQVVRQTIVVKSACATSESKIEADPLAQRVLCDNNIFSNIPGSVSLQLCMSCSVKWGNKCTRCDAPAMFNSNPGMGCQSCGFRKKQHCARCDTFFGLTGRPALICHHCSLKMGHMKKCSNTMLNG